MNRRGFFSSALALVGLTTLTGALSAEQDGDVAQPVPTTCTHTWVGTPYVLVYGEQVVRRGPAIWLCSRCGGLRVDVGEHRNVTVQHFYDVAREAEQSRRRPVDEALSRP
jgi:hypothetical protein